VLRDHIGGSFMAGLNQTLVGKTPGQNGCAGRALNPEPADEEIHRNYLLLHGSTSEDMFLSCEGKHRHHSAEPPTEIRQRDAILALRLLR
jgi:hypothetical protein